MSSSRANAPHRQLLGKAIRRRREAFGHSQEKLAELIDCHRNYVGLVERGEQNLTIDMLARFAAALGCTTAELLEDCGV